MSTELLNQAHIDIIEKSANLGELTIGVYTDEALIALGKVPILEEQARLKVLGSLKGVSNVVFQSEVSYKKVLTELKPDIVVHGDDWISGPQEKIREEVIETLKAWNGELVEFPYAKDIQADDIFNRITKRSYLPEVRRRRLKHYLQTRKLIRIIEAHNGLTGLIAEHTTVEKNGKQRGFHGMWVSSLCDSTAKGKPDIELVDHSSRLTTIQEIMDVTTKPIILDGDSGGLTEHFVHNIKTIERAGVSAIIIEDKIGLKKNSLFGDAGQSQDTIENFCDKIRQGKAALTSADFAIIARIESLILNQGMEDAVARAKAYLDAGADGIMIHSAKKTPDEIFEFCDRYREFGNKPLIVVPSTYNMVTEEELEKKGVNVVIYANHLIRAAFPAMEKTAKLILENERSLEADEVCMPIKQILTLIPE
jgi:phosphoenolpyruvate phosphomutase